MIITRNGGVSGWLARFANDDGTPVSKGEPESSRDWGSYSEGECPDQVVTEAAKSQTPDGYPMTIRDQETWSAIAKAVNMGIDSHLDAFTKSSFDCKTGKCLVHPDELHILLRRLFDNGDEDSCRLRTDILSTLGIEEV